MGRRDLLPVRTSEGKMYRHNFTGQLFNGATAFRQKVFDKIVKPVLTSAIRRTTTGTGGKRIETKKKKAIEPSRQEKEKVLVQEAVRETMVRERPREITPTAKPKQRAQVEPVDTLIEDKFWQKKKKVGISAASQ